MNHLVEIKNVSKKYIKNKVYNLIIDKGEIILLNGKNGSGKTTLIKLILNFIFPDKGEVVLKENLKVSYLKEQTTLPSLMHTISYIDSIAEIKNTLIDKEFLDKLNIPLEKRIYKLSKGNKQKVAIFTTFLGKNDLIILDEPLSGLDDEQVKIIKKEILKLNKNGISFLISEHHNKIFSNIATKEYTL